MKDQILFAFGNVYYLGAKYSNIILSNMYNECSFCIFDGWQAVLNTNISLFMDVTINIIITLCFSYWCPFSVIIIHWESFNTNDANQLQDVHFISIQCFDPIFTCNVIVFYRNFMQKSFFICFPKKVNMLKPEKSWNFEIMGKSIQ